MTDRAIVDAGPALNFFSINKERLLLDAIGQISAPETVAEEIRRKARQDARFQVASIVWAKSGVYTRKVTIIPTGATDGRQSASTA